MAIVEPDERAAAAGILSVSRNAGAALAPLFTGAILANPVLGWPFLLAGGLKVIYDLMIFAVFRKGETAGRRELTWLGSDRGSYSLEAAAWRAGQPGR
jgi:MFS family permease